MQITAYKLLRGPLAKIEEAVNAHLKEGWQPWGYVVQDPGNVSYAMQGLVRYGPNLPNQIAYVVTSDVADLSEKVTNRVNEGWSAFGSVAMAFSGSEVRFCQAMVRARPEGEE
jgi:hypothetical protein